MTIIEKIKAEIERLKKAQEVSEDKDYAQYELDVACGYDEALNDILSFLDTLESKKPMNQEGLEEEIKQEVGDKRICETMLYPYEYVCDIARHFAEWQKEQMMKEVVEGEYDSYPVAIYLEHPIPRTKNGDKVRIIVVKEN